MPDTQPDKIKITEKLKRLIRSEIDRTGYGPSTILRGKRSEIPKGLNGSVIRSWLNGDYNTAHAEHVAFVLAQWEALPDEREAYIDLSPEHNALLRRKLQDTSLSPRKLFAERNDMPEGFDWKRVHNILGGNIKKLKKEHYSYMLHVFEDCQDQGYREITEDIRCKIRDEIERTDVALAEAIRQGKSNKAPVVQPATVYQWLNGKIQSGEAKAIDYILELYKQYPDKSENNKAITYEDLRFSSMEPIAEKDLKRLLYYRDRYGLLPSKIFKVTQEPPPEGLSKYMISNWFSGNSKSADPEHIKWVLDQCRAFEKFNHM